MKARHRATWHQQSSAFGLIEVLGLLVGFFDYLINTDFVNPTHEEVSLTTNLMISLLQCFVSKLVLTIGTID